MFEFVTISNGVAVVRHGRTGHVYRFRPMQPGIWSRLTLDRIDVCQNADEMPVAHADAALSFAEAAASDFFDVARVSDEEPEWVPVRGLRSMMRGRDPARRHPNR